MEEKKLPMIIIIANISIQIPMTPPTVTPYGLHQNNNISLKIVSDLQSSWKDMTKYGVGTILKMIVMIVG